MSTVLLGYPEVIRVQRVPAIGRILVLSSLVLIAITILVTVISAANADLTDRPAVSQNSVVAIPVPTPAITEIQPVPSETPAPFSVETNEPSVVPVPVPAPPSQ